CCRCQISAKSGLLCSGIVAYFSPEWVAYFAPERWHTIVRIIHNGTYVEISRNKYLLFLNDRHTPESDGSKSPLPMRVGLFSTNKDLLADKKTVAEVLQQLNDFCYMHWRSVRQHNQPATITYARMLAEQASWFTDEPLPEGVRHLPWFI
ncbi:MAG: hypothetical protein RBS07_11005, partial [Lentimicrobium sp.]|nr:hypothetical protein [Lentimicrobium sp.]